MLKLRITFYDEWNWPEEVFTVPEMVFDYMTRDFTYDWRYDAYYNKDNTVCIAVLEWR